MENHILDNSEYLEYLEYRIKVDTEYRDKIKAEIESEFKILCNKMKLVRELGINVKYMKKEKQEKKEKIKYWEI
ncbi:MAG: hypothetical protein WC934_06120 [Acidithiobacillus sp.]|uniref:hypothetical protein n=1 Tax=Acidithiobacillus sp. TaxID=1872118 RepID=UPI00355E5CFA